MSRHVTFATIDDADHFTPERRAEIIAAYPAHEREARTRGIPVLGSGRIFPVEEAAIVVEPFLIPDIWSRINGLDFGWNHPFGAAGCAYDADADCFYVTKEYRERESTPLIHSGSIRPWGDWIPNAWPHDGLQHDKGSGETLKDQYRGHGLNMLPERATFMDGGNGVEAGVLDMLERMQTDRWKVFSTCGAWLSEFRLYHREDGKIVKEADDLISASRYALMMKRFAKTKPRPAPAMKPAPRMPQGSGWMR